MSIDVIKAKAPPFVPLWVKSNASLLTGASHPEELVDTAADLGLHTLALTDRDSLSGCVRAWVRGKERGVRVVVGAEVTVGPLAEAGIPVLLLAQDRGGYGRLCRLLTLGHQRREKGWSQVTPTELAEAATGLVALSPSARAVAWCAQPFEGRHYALVSRHLRPEEVEAEARLRAEAQVVGAPLVAAPQVLYHHPGRRFLADVLAAIRHRVPLDEAGRKLRPNAEHALPTSALMERRFSDLPEAVARTEEVAGRCAFGLSQLRYRYPLEHLPEGQSEQSWLHQLTFAGAATRYPKGIPADVRAQLERELSLVEELQYGGYFLTMWDLVHFCQSRGILCQGRGSAANSAVCYCLGITAIDPVRMDLLFERFLSRERAEPPDIDLDIEHQRREEVIQYVYERWGRRRAAMVANIVRYRAKSALRDVGKALGLPQTALDQASKLLSYWGGEVEPSALSRAGLDPNAARVRKLLRLTEEIQHFPRHLSIHPGGFLLGAEPVDTLVPVEPATMPGRTVVQWDKQDIEDLGLFKVDLLGLGMLSQIRGCFDLLRQHEATDLTIASIPPDDPHTFGMISKGDTVGVFQIESRAQMSMLPRLRPQTFYDLVIEVAIVRPGPIQGDMVHPYLRRRAGEEAVSYPHPSLERVLQKTLGVPIFQEQVMKLAVLAAGYSPGEADQLRRDMAAWRSRGRIEEHRTRLVGRMIEKGIPKPFAEQVFSQIRGFGEYGFPESHAASFALLSYVTAWLKCNHHAAFTCALLNAWPMGFYQPATLVEDARRHGVVVQPIDVNHSDWDCTLEPCREGEGPRPEGASASPWAVRMGLRYIKGFGQAEKDRLAAPQSGPQPAYRDLKDFVQRTRLRRRPLLSLAEAGAFSSLGLDRRQALWALRGILSTDLDGLDLAPSAHPKNQRAFAPLERREEVSWDYRTSQHSTRGHPMERWRATLRQRRIPDAKGLAQLSNGEPVTYVGMVICRQRPGTATGVTFFTLEDETGFVNVIVWRRVFERFSTIAKTAAVLEVEGEVQKEHGVLHLIAHRLREAARPNPAEHRSRDFR